MPPRRKQSIAEGIVVRARDLGEADRIVVMLTPERGLLSCVARSARKPGSKLGGQVDLLRHVSASMSEGRSDLHTITQAETINAFLGLRSDLDRLTMASHFAEIAERFSLPSAPNPNMFLTLRDALGFAEVEDKSKLPMLRLWFEMTAMRAVGLQPQLRHCVRTGSEIPPDDHWFSPSEGGIVRRIDQPNGEDTDRLESSSPDPAIRDDGELLRSAPLLSAPLNTLKLLRHVERYPEWERHASLKVEPGIVEDGLRLSSAALGWQQERKSGQAERVMADVVRGRRAASLLRT